MSSLASIFNVFSRMSARERTLVGGALLILVLVCMYTFVLDPLTVGRAQLSRAVGTKERQLRSMVDMRHTYLDLNQKLQSGEQMLSKADPNFQLFTFLETTISQVIPRERISSMNPGSKNIGQEFEEQTVEIKLTQVSLEQLVGMLHRIEKSDHPLRVTRLQVKKRPKDIYNFDVIATVSLVKAISNENPPPAA